MLRIFKGQFFGFGKFIEKAQIKEKGLKLPILLWADEFYHGQMNFIMGQKRANQLKAWLSCACPPCIQLKISQVPIPLAFN